MKHKLFSIRESDFGNLVFLGMGFGTCGKRPSLEIAIFLVIGKTVITVGPHK